MQRSKVTILAFKFALDRRRYSSRNGRVEPEEVVEVEDLASFQRELNRLLGAKEGYFLSYQDEEGKMIGSSEARAILGPEIDDEEII